MPSHYCTAINRILSPKGDLPTAATAVPLLRRRLLNQAIVFGATTVKIMEKLCGAIPVRNSVPRLELVWGVEACTLCSCLRLNVHHEGMKCHCLSNILNGPLHV